MISKPYEHQVKAFERFKDLPFGGLFLEQGLGKSKVAIDIVNHKFTKGEITGVLVITPKSLVDNWALVEIPKHSAIPGNIMAWRTSNKKEMEFPRPGLGPVWFIANIDAVILDRWVTAFREFYKKHPKFALIIDESTTVKTPGSQRTKRMLQVADYAKARFVLSGAPITNSPLDMWAQGEVLNPGIWGRNYFLFKHHYAIHKKMEFGGRHFQKVVGYQNLDDLSNRVNRFAVIAKKKDCLDLPPKIYRQIPIPFTDEQKEHYKNMKHLALTEIDNTTIHIVNAVSLINSLLQVCAGQIKLPEGGYKYLDTNRVSLLNDVMDESPEKALIWCSFVGAADEIENRLPTLKKDEPNRVLRIRAETPADARQDILKFYEQTPEKYGLLLNQASMGRGLTILEGRNMVYYSQRFSVEQRVQSEDRPDRIGQTRSVLITEFYTPGTVEEKVIKVLRDSRDLADTIIKDRSKLRELIAT